jgi:integrase
MTRGAVVDVQFPYVYTDTDRHGNVRVYYWRGKGMPKTRIKEPLGSPEFVARYKELTGGGDAPPAASDPNGAPAPGTWRWLAENYMRSRSFLGLDSQTQSFRRGVLTGTFAEPRRPGAPEVFGDMPASKMGPKQVRVLRDRKAAAGFPTAANHRIKCIGYVFAWAIDDDTPGIEGNPARDVPHEKALGGGHHTWTEAEIEQFERRHPIGTKARLAFAIFRYTGLRKSDAVRLGKQHLRNGWLRMRQYKNRKRHPVDIEIPVLPELARIIEASPTGDLTLLVTSLGVPFSIKGFGNKFREWCDEAELPQCSAHGIRKADATMAADNGATTHELQSMFGWKSLTEAETYTRKANRKKLAGKGMKLIGDEDGEAEPGTKLSHRDIG